MGILLLLVIFGFIFILSAVIGSSLYSNDDDVKDYIRRKKRKEKRK